MAANHSGFQIWRSTYPSTKLRCLTGFPTTASDRLLRHALSSFAAEHGINGFFLLSWFRAPLLRRGVAEVMIRYLPKSHVVAPMHTHRVPYRSIPLLRGSADKASTRESNQSEATTHRFEPESAICGYVRMPRARVAVRLVGGVRACSTDAVDVRTLRLSAQHDSCQCGLR